MFCCIEVQGDLFFLIKPPSKPVEYFDELESLISSIQSEDKDTIMLGDTNCNFLDNSDNDTKHLKRTLMTYKMTEIIKESTRTNRYKDFD